MSELIIRMAAPSDAEALLAIYAPYVEHTAVSFEYDVPSPEVFAERIRSTLERYPYLVAQRGGEIAGYAYTGPFRTRKAYSWGAETSIYVRQDLRGQGVGGRLYGALEAVSKRQNILNLNACIAFPEEADEYLTQDSVRFHAHLGYRTVGTFRRCGYKFGRWYDMVWMEKLIGDHPADPPEVIPAGALPDLQALLSRFSDPSAL